MGDKILFSYYYQQHQLKITQVTRDWVEFEVESQPQSFRLNKGDSVEVDLDNDDVFDLTVTLENILASKATLLVESHEREEVRVLDFPPPKQKEPSAEPTTEPAEPAMEEPSPVEQEQTEPTTQFKKSNMAYWLVTILIVITVGAALYWMTVPPGKRNKR